MERSTSALADVLADGDDAASHLVDLAGASHSLPLLADQQFILNDQLQELGVAELVAGRFLETHVQRLGQSREA